MKSKTIIIFVLLILLFVCRVKENKSEDKKTITYYVSPSGSNSNDGSLDSPWATINFGINSLKAGEKLIVLSGEYFETIVANNIGGSEGKIYIEGESVENTIVNGSSSERDLIFFERCKNIEISNLTIKNAKRAGIRLSYSDNITIKDAIFLSNGKWGVFTDFSDYTEISNCDIFDSKSEHGIYISNSSDNAIIKNNNVYNNYACGIQINADPSMGGDGISSNCIIENSILYGNGEGGGAAINLASVRDSVIQNNIIFNNYAGGIAAWDDAQGNEWGSKNLSIIHNTIYFKKDEGRYAISIKNGSTDAAIINNILLGGARGGFEITEGSLLGISIDYNIYFRANSELIIQLEDELDFTLQKWQEQGYDLNSFIISPKSLFINLISGNFHLKEGASAVDKGKDTGLNYDFEGELRPKGNGYDIGADEK